MKQTGLPALLELGENKSFEHKDLEIVNCSMNYVTEK